MNSNTKKQLIIELQNKREIRYFKQIMEFAKGHIKNAPEKEIDKIDKQLLTEFAKKLLDTTLSVGSLTVVENKIKAEE